MEKSVEAAGIEPARHSPPIDLLEGCRICCGLCEVEIGDQPLDEHYATCRFVNAPWHEFGEGSLLMRELPRKGGFEHWKLDGEGVANAVERSVHHSSEHAVGVAAEGPVSNSPPSPSNFSAKTTVCGIDFEVRRDDRHLNLHLYEEGEIWRFEELEQAIPKLEAILGAAKMAANLEVLDDTG